MIHLIRASVLSLCIVGYSASAFAQDPEPNPDMMKPFWFVIGSCWEGYFEGSETDKITRCYRPMYRGKAIRDNFVIVQGDTRTIGEAIYAWDGATETIRYQAVDSSGGTSIGTAVPYEGDDGFSFPDEVYTAEDGTVTRIQSKIERVERDVIRQTVEAVTEDGIDPMFSVLYERKVLSYGPRP